MENAHRARHRIAWPAVVGLSTSAAALLAGCGSDDTYKNTARPAAPIVVGVQIDDQRVRVSPQQFGAGPITLVISNQSSASQQVTLETAGSAKGRRPVQTGPISPRETASVRATVVQGTYALRVGDGTESANLTIVRPRPSSQNDLLQP
jgi:hypothetical protein